MAGLDARTRITFNRVLFVLRVLTQRPDSILIRKCASGKRAQRNLPEKPWQNRRLRRGS